MRFFSLQGQLVAPYKNKLYLCGLFCQMEYLKRILKYLKNYKLQIVLIACVQLLYAVFSVFTLTLLVPFLQILFNQAELVLSMPKFSLSPQYIINVFYYLMSTIIVRSGREAALLFIALTMIMLSFLSNLCRYLGLFWLSYIRSGILYNIRDQFYSKLIRLPFSFYSEARAGDIVGRVSTDVLEVEWTVVSSLMILCRDPFLMIAYIVTLLYISPKLSLTAFILIPAMGILLSVIGKNIRNYSLRAQELLGRVTSYFEEAVDGLRIIKGYNAQEYVSGQFEEENFKIYRLNKKIIRIKESGSPIVEFLSILTLLVISLIGLVAFPDSFMANGSTLLLFFVVFARMIPPAKSLASTYYQIQKGMSAAKRVYEIIDADEGIHEVGNPEHISEFKSSIEFKDVSFSYDKGDNKVLKHLNFKILKGEKVAIVGPSGGGKSTLINLLPRFYDVDSGQILIDGKSQREYSLKDLRGLFGIVNQENFLFDDTVYNNIVFGLGDVSEERVVEAAKIAQAHNFIMELEDGYQTGIGNRGMRLSGGQRQRLCIARAILRDPQIFILDEATSALDNESELLFQEAVLPLLEGKTGIIIAHRLSTIRFADKIIFIKDGEISEIGTHQELMDRGGDYYRFCSVQQIAE